jgi:hypothetical protein
MMKQLCSIFEEKEDELRSDPSFEEVRQEDMDAVEAFRMALGLSSKGKVKKKRAHSTTAAMEESDEEDENPLITPQSRSSKYRVSQASSARSNRSSILSPLAEDEGSDSDDDDVPITTLKKRKLSTPTRQGPIDEGSDEDDVTTSTFGATPKSRKMSSDATPRTQDKSLHSSIDEDEDVKSLASHSMGVTRTPQTDDEEPKNNEASDEDDQ